MHIGKMQLLLQSSHRSIGSRRNTRRIFVTLFIVIQYYFVTWTGIITTTTETLPQHKSEVAEVTWVRDEAWFEEQAQKGCCPFAKTLYEPRYASVNYRCCTDKIKEGTIEPLRATGGVDFLQIKRNATILFQGDSLAEQHFLGMICFAWSEHNMVVNLQRLSEERDSSQGTIWSASIRIEGDVVLTVQFLRWNRPVIASNEAYNLLETPDYIFLGGWHHGGIDIRSIETFVTKVQDRWKPQLGHKSIVVDALSSHFPGGLYIRSGVYPDTNNTTGFCEQSSLTVDPDIAETLELIRNKTNITLLYGSKLYYKRGDAHIGYIPSGTIGPRGRDCLHWCIAPGVLDALVRQTLAAIYLQ